MKKGMEEYMKIFGGWRVYNDFYAFLVISEKSLLI
jgi:hypothetical protein